MTAKALAVIYLFVVNFKLCQCRKYTNYSLITAVPRTYDDMKFLQNLESQKYIEVIFWERPVKLDKRVEILVGPTDLELFKERADHFKLNYEMNEPDIQRMFDKQIVGGYRYLRFDTFHFNNYHNLDDIYQWMTDLTQNNKFIYLESIGKSVEGRDIKAMRVNKNKARDKVIVEGGIHGHEWLSVAFVTYLLNEVIQSEKSQFQSLDNLAKRYEWLIIPVVNPDGYSYTHKTDRLWRKNRKKYSDGYGVDLNRNFDHAFCKFSSSKSPNDDNYCGKSPLSEPESTALAEYIKKNKLNLKYYFSIHGFGQMIIVPYEDRIKHVENFSEMENYAKQAINKMYKYNGTKYITGSIYDTTGTRVSGTSTSWVKKVYRVPYVYTWFLRDKGKVGHAVPSKDIIPTCQEATLGITELMTARPKYVRALYSRSSSVHAPCLVIVLALLVFE